MAKSPIQKQTQHNKKCTDKDTRTLDIICFSLEFSQLLLSQISRPFKYSLRYPKFEISVFEDSLCKPLKTNLLHGG